MRRRRATVVAPGTVVDTGTEVDGPDVVVDSSAVVDVAAVVVTTASVIAESGDASVVGFADARVVAVVGVVGRPGVMLMMPPPAAPATVLAEEPDPADEPDPAEEPDPADEPATGVPTLPVSVTSTDGLGSSTSGPSVAADVVRFFDDEVLVVAVFFLAVPALLVALAFVVLVDLRVVEREEEVFAFVDETVRAAVAGVGETAGFAVVAVFPGIGGPKDLPPLVWPIACGMA